MAPKKTRDDRKPKTDPTRSAPAAPEVSPLPIRPRLGARVKVAIADDHRVRDLVSQSVVNSGDVVTWSTYYERHRLAGAFKTIEDDSIPTAG